MANQVTAEIGLKDNFSQAVDSIKASMQQLNKQFGLQEGGIAALNKSFRAHQKEIINLERQYQELSSEAKNTDFGQSIKAQLAALKAAAAEEKDSIADTKKEIANLSTDTPKLDIMTQSMGLLSSSMATAASVAGLFGSENEKVAQIMRVTAVITQVLNMATSIFSATQREGLAGLIAGTFAHKAKTKAEQADTTALALNTQAETTNGIAKAGSTVKNAALSVSNVVAAGTTQLFTRAVQSLNVAFAENPIGFVLTALTTLLTLVMTAVGIFGSSADAVDEDSKSLDANAEAAKADAQAKAQLSEEIRSNTAKDVTAYEELRAAYTSLRSEHEKTKWIEANKEKFKELGLEVFNTVDADDAFIGNTNNVIKALTLRAQAAATAAYYQKMYENALARINGVKAGQEVTFKNPQQRAHFLRLGYAKEGGEWFSNGHIYNDRTVLTEKGAQRERDTQLYNAQLSLRRGIEQTTKFTTEATNTLKNITASGRSGRSHTTTTTKTGRGGTRTGTSTHTETDAEKRQKAWNESVKKLNEENTRLDLLLKQGVITQRQYNDSLQQNRESFLKSSVALAAGNKQRVDYYTSIYDLWQKTKREIEVQDTWGKAEEEYRQTIQELNAKYRDGVITVDELNKSAAEAAKTLKSKTATVANELSIEQQKERNGISDTGLKINTDTIIDQLSKGLSEILAKQVTEYFNNNIEQNIAYKYGTKEDQKANPFAYEKNGHLIATENYIPNDSRLQKYKNVFKTDYQRVVANYTDVLQDMFPKDLSFNEQLSYHQGIIKKADELRQQVFDMYREARKKVKDAYDLEMKPLQDNFSDYTNKSDAARANGKTELADAYDKKANEYETKLQEKQAELDSALQRTVDATTEILDFINEMSVKAAEYITGYRHYFGTPKKGALQAVDIPDVNAPMKTKNGKKAQDLRQAAHTENVFNQLADSNLSSIYGNIKKLKDTIDDMDENKVTLDNLAEGFSAIGTAASNMGAALQALGASSALAKAGLVAAAIGQVILGFAMASKDAAKYGVWAWIAASAAGLATLLTTVAQIKQMNGGGIVGGSGISGDSNLVRLNTGEMVLNRNQQMRLLNIADGHYQGGMSVSTVRVKGSDLYLALSNYGKIKNQTGKKLF